jgi:hypothetical protein
MVGLFALVTKVFKRNKDFPQLLLQAAVDLIPELPFFLQNLLLHMEVM